MRIKRIIIRQIFFRSTQIWIKYAVRLSVLFVITLFFPPEVPRCLEEEELHGKDQSVQHVSKWKEKTFMELLSLKLYSFGFTMNYRQFTLKAACLWIILIKTLLLWSIWSILALVCRDMALCFLFSFERLESVSTTSSKTAYTVLWMRVCVCVASPFRDLNMRWVCCDLYCYHGYVDNHG